MPRVDDLRAISSLYQCLPVRSRTQRRIIQVAPLLAFILLFEGLGTWHTQFAWVLRASLPRITMVVSRPEFTVSGTPANFHRLMSLNPTQIPFSPDLKSNQPQRFKPARPHLAAGSRVFDSIGFMSPFEL
jgi:hypothetical protein